MQLLHPQDLIAQIGKNIFSDVGELAIFFQLDEHFSNQPEEDYLDESEPVFSEELWKIRIDIQNKHITCLSKKNYQNKTGI